MTTTPNLYNNIRAEDLKFLLGNVDVFNKETASLSDWLNEVDQKPLREALSNFSWAPLYELSFRDCLGYFFIDSQLTAEASKIAESENKIHATHNFQQNLTQNLDIVSNSLPENQQLDFATAMIAYGTVMMKSSRSLMIYGHYINDLVALARTADNPKQRDIALMNAIRMDASVVCCPTASYRISQAVLFNEIDFFKKLKNAIAGKLGELEDRNFQKMRFILQVLHESGGINLSDKALKELFVEQLNLYSDSQFTAEKNLGEMARNFKKKKSTI